MSMHDDLRAPPPYHEILNDLIASTMRAQGELVGSCSTRKAITDFPDARINRHFSWLALTYAVGWNRHLFEGGNNFPLRTQALRAKKQLHAKAKAILDQRCSLPLVPSEEFDDNLVQACVDLVQPRATRISSLIKLVFQQTLVAEADEFLENDNVTEAPKESKTHAERSPRKPLLISPLLIVYDYLTIPEIPGSRAYVLLALRNYLFESFGIVPAGLGAIPEKDTFSPRQVEEAHSRVWTSLRPRHYSGGEDKLPRQGKHAIDGLLRQFLALKGVLWFRFANIDQCLQYCNAGVFHAKQVESAAEKYELNRSLYLEHLPDSGEIINELWGVPIPVRGGDTIFRGGLKFSTRQGLVVAVHGGPGTGKTSLALALGAYLAPLQIDTLFLTGEEVREDLLIRVEGLVPAEFRRLTFYPKKASDWLTIESIRPHQGGGEEPILASIEAAFDVLRSALAVTSPDNGGVPKPCRAIIVLDGLHDIFFPRGHASDSGQQGKTSQANLLRSFIDKCRELRALVILTTSQEWAGDAALDYLVDVSLHLSYASNLQSSAKPDRQLLLSKARHQLCAIGTHGIQIAGAKGLRFSPGIIYQLDRMSIWKTRLPEERIVKNVIRRTLSAQDAVKMNSRQKGKGWWPEPKDFYSNRWSVYLYEGANIFVNGQGSGGKAALALKLAISPSFHVGVADEGTWPIVEVSQKILIISFLYPDTYYKRIMGQLIDLREAEYGLPTHELKPKLHVMHLYPGDYKPRDLFNKIEWELEAAELYGEPYNCAIIDGIHNVFIQFPEIVKQGLFWPQLYTSLRARSLTIITTHTTLTAPYGPDGKEYKIDDDRSEPLRHALVQKTDFQIEVDPITRSQVLSKSQSKTETGKFEPNNFTLKVLSSINQPIPEGNVFWSRENLILFGAGREIDGDEKNISGRDPTQPVLPLMS